MKWYKTQENKMLGGKARKWLKMSKDREDDPAGAAEAPSSVKMALPKAYHAPKSKAPPPGGSSALSKDQPVTGRVLPETRQGSHDTLSADKAQATGRVARLLTVQAEEATKKPAPQGAETPVPDDHAREQAIPEQGLVSEDIQEQIAAKTKSLESITKKLDSVKTEYNSIVGKLMATKREYNKKQADIKLVRNEHDKILEKVKAVRHAPGTADRPMGTGKPGSDESISRRLRMEIDADRTRIESLKRQLASITRSYEAAMSRKDAEISRHDALVPADGVLPVSPADPPNVVRAAGAVVESIKRRLNETRQELEATRQKLDSTKRQLDYTRQELDSTKRQLDYTRQDLEATKQKLGAAPRQSPKKMSA